MEKILIHTKKKREVVDVTDIVNEKLKDKKEGICVLFLMHTTAALTTADLDPGTDLDLLDAIDKIIPKLNYRHPHDPSHTPDHIASSMIGSSLTIPFENGELILGTWQRVVLLEFDGPRERSIVIKAQ